MAEARRLILERGDPRDAVAWTRRLEADAVVARRHQTSELRAVTDIVVSRALASGAQGVALTGSTARDRRTRISDLDYHVVGARPEVLDLPSDVDIYESPVTKLETKLLTGDDFVQWTLCCGCILYDAGPFRAAATTVVELDLWPDSDAKLRRLPELRRLAMRLIDMEDRDAAHDQVRATLTSAARGMLLRQGEFALARSELPEQLRAIALHELADGLEASIFAEPSLEELRTMLDTIQAYQLAPAS